MLQALLHVRQGAVKPASETSTLPDQVKVWLAGLAPVKPVGTVTVTVYVPPGVSSPVVAKK